MYVVLCKQSGEKRILPANTTRVTAGDRGGCRTGIGRRRGSWWDVWALRHRSTLRRQSPGLVRPSHKVRIWKCLGLRTEPIRTQA